MLLSLCSHCSHCEWFNQRKKLTKGVVSCKRISPSLVRLQDSCLRNTWMEFVNKSSPATRHGGAWGDRRYSSYSFSTSALDGGEWSASRPGRAFTPGTHCTGSWVGPRAGRDTETRGKIRCPCRGSNPDRPVVQPVVRDYTAWANPAPGICKWRHKL
jgi:hypothetical protein